MQCSNNGNKYQILATFGLVMSLSETRAAPAHTSSEIKNTSVICDDILLVNS